MHIEPGIVDGAKIVLSYATAGLSGLFALKLASSDINERGALSFAARSAITTALVFCFFEVLPHYPVGVSEVHLILGSTLFLLFGMAPAAIGLAVGLLAQGLLFAPYDLQQYGMNVTTLLVPLFALRIVASQAIAPGMRYVDLKYRQALTLSVTYQAGIVTWVAFWALYGHGIGIDNLASIGTFGLSYMLVISIEPLVDIMVLAIAKSNATIARSSVFDLRLLGQA
ncbi:cobalt transporter [Rhizobium sp. Leaf306]|uniref:energy-coupling factor ABC transporter permease n=1 Tax=Rhizobium sp. Leaf306 TaxID=1736330 RepID=UPI000714D1F6|nr:energy-coupling factor ABC transporter permease [Rhizobium sp. Leaf306]KQQ38851.1 cobalt transporter [Rhizobium sp. Leaf306]